MILFNYMIFLPFNSCKFTIFYIKPTYESHKFDSKFQDLQELNERKLWNWVSILFLAKNISNAS